MGLQRAICGTVVIPMLTSGQVRHCCTFENLLCSWLQPDHARLYHEECFWPLARADVPRRDLDFRACECLLGHDSHVDGQCRGSQFALECLHQLVEHKCA